MKKIRVRTRGTAKLDAKVELYYSENDSSMNIKIYDENGEVIFTSVSSNKQPKAFNQAEMLWNKHIKGESHHDIN